MNRKEHLKILDIRFKDIESYIESIHDEEIRSTLCFFLFEDIDEMVREINNLEYEVWDLEKKQDDLEDTIDDLEETIEELEDKIEDDKEVSLDWSIVMDTFYSLQSKMNPWEFEKLIIEKYEKRN